MEQAYKVEYELSDQSNSQLQANVLNIGIF